MICATGSGVTLARAAVKAAIVVRNMSPMTEAQSSPASCVRPPAFSVSNTHISTAMFKAKNSSAPIRAVVAAIISLGLVLTKPRFATSSAKSRMLKATPISAATKKIGRTVPIVRTVSRLIVSNMRPSVSAGVR